jgi:hypothetical protein
MNDGQDGELLRVSTVGQGKIFNWKLQREKSVVLKVKDI